MTAPVTGELLPCQLSQMGTRKLRLELSLHSSSVHSHIPLLSRLQFQPEIAQIQPKVAARTPPIPFLDAQDGWASLACASRDSSLSEEKQMLCDIFSPTIKNPIVGIMNN